MSAGARTAARRPIAAGTAGIRPPVQSRGPRPVPPGPAPPPRLVSRARTVGSPAGTRGARDTPVCGPKSAGRPAGQPALGGGANTDRSGAEAA